MFLKLDDTATVNMDNVDKITFEGTPETDTGKISFLKYTGASVEPVVLMEKSFATFNDYCLYRHFSFDDNFADIIKKL